MKADIDLTEERVFSSEKPERPQNAFVDWELKCDVWEILHGLGKPIESEFELKLNPHNPFGMYDTNQICDCCRRDIGKIPWRCNCYSSTYTPKIPWKF